MLKLGIIGTGAISHHFIAGTQETHSFQLAAIYSRTMENAQTFAQKYPFSTKLYTDLTTFLQSDIDIVYIASPNSLHYQQSKEALWAKKHVIVEKPAVTQPKQWHELVTIAKQQEVFLFEAARNYHEQAFTIISDFLADKEIWGAQFGYTKYSSKMPALLSGHVPNVFSSEFAGGALMDLGIYPIYASIRLFGQPLSAHYMAQQLPNTIDLNGAGQLIYPNFQVSIHTGKNSNSFLASEIYTNQGTLVLDTIEHIRSAVFYPLKGNKLELPITQANHTMLEEIEEFARMIAAPNLDSYENWLSDAQAVHTTLYRMRQTANIYFEGEIHENKTTD